MIDRRSEIGPEGGSTLRHYLRTLWRRKWLLVLPLVLIPVVTYVATKRQAALYEASADVLVNRQEVATTSVIGQTPALDDPGRTMDTQSNLARVPTVVNRTLAAAGLRDRSPQSLLGRSAVYPVSDLLRFTVDDPDPRIVTRLASEYARQFVRYRRQLDTSGLAATRRELEQELRSLEAAGKTGSPLYLRLADRQQQLATLEALRLSNVSVVMVPDQGDVEQVAPRPLRNTAVAGAAGLVVGLILAFLGEALSTRPRSEDEVEAILGTPCLGRLRSTARRDRLTRDEGASDADVFHAVRTSLELANDRAGARTVMLTSPRAGESTTEVTANLALAFARAGRHVVVVDLDLRRRRLTDFFGLDDHPGVTSLASGTELAGTLVPIPVGAATTTSADAAGNGAGMVTGLLEVAPAGPAFAAPVEVLASPGLAEGIAALERRASLVLVEAPSLLETSDAAAISRVAQGLVLVLDSRRARRPVLGDVRRATQAWPLTQLGFVLVDDRPAEPAFAPVWRTRDRTTTSESERVG